MEEKVTEAYGYLLEQPLIKEIAQVGTFREIKKGDCLIDFGDPLLFMPLMLNGAIKILRQDNEGDELLLYFLEAGDTCTMTMTCSLGKSKSEIRAVAEKDSALVMVPVQKMSEWLHYATWRAFVFTSFDHRFKEMLESIESLAFMNMHDRILKYLRDKAIVNKSMELQTTHQEIADDLHTSRVVISRILKSLEREGRIKLNRNLIEIIDF